MGDINKKKWFGFSSRIHLKTIEIERKKKQQHTTKSINVRHRKNTKTKSKRTER